MKRQCGLVNSTLASTWTQDEQVSLYLVQIGEVSEDEWDGNSDADTWTKPML